ncbi:MAG: hypothetical protein LBK23_07985 [Oscillospiraceae bacterium]|jgi:hypothetical protein|nr:hypothetical protein [Oscillospiraceae bacterium]
MKKQFIALIGLLVALTVFTACNGTTPYIPPLKETDAGETDNRTSPTPIVEPGEVKPVPTRPPEAVEAASMPPVTPTPEATATPKPTVTATPTQKPTVTEAPEPTPEPEPEQGSFPKPTRTPDPANPFDDGRDPYVDDEGIYHRPTLTLDGSQTELIYYKNDEGNWTEATYAKDGGLYIIQTYDSGKTPRSAPGAPWEEEANKKAEELSMVKKEFEKLINQNYTQKETYEKLYEMGLVKKEVQRQYTIKYLTSKYGAEIGYIHDYDDLGYLFRDKNGNWVSSYLDSTNHAVEGFYYEGGNPYYDENGNYVGQRIQHDEEGMHWENVNGKMVGTYKGVVIPVPYVEPIPPLG